MSAQAFCLLSILGAQATAAEVAISTTNAEGWILENYTGGPVVIWYTGAVCENNSQNISIQNPAPGEVNRLWSTVMTAKASNTKIFIRYDTRNCNIASFGFS